MSTPMIGECAVWRMIIGLPQNITTKNIAHTNQRVLVRSRNNFQFLNVSIPPKPTPTASLHSCRLRIEYLLECLKAAKSILDDLTQLGCRVKICGGWRGRGEVGPEERVIDVPSTVELEGSLERDPLLCVVGFDICFFSGVQTRYIGLMMFGVMEFHDLLWDIWFEGLLSDVSCKTMNEKNEAGIVSVRKFWECVHGCSPLNKTTSQKSWTDSGSCDWQHGYEEICVTSK